MLSYATLSSYWSKRCNANSQLLVSQAGKQACSRQTKRRLNLSRKTTKAANAHTAWLLLSFFVFCTSPMEYILICVVLVVDVFCWCSLCPPSCLLHLSLHRDSSYLLTSADLNIKHICFVMLFCWMPRITFSNYTVAHFSVDFSLLCFSDSCCCYYFYYCLLH